MINDLLTKIEDRYGYLRYHDNWHKHPIVSRVLCWLGRHDYEYEGKVVNGAAYLACFYCLHRKNSSRSS